MRNYLLFLSLVFFCSYTVYSQSLSSFGESKLPLVVIRTNNQVIPDEPKILAEMGIIWNGEGQMNAGSDAFNDYQGKIAIELRGSSSQMFPKKSYGLELRDAANQDLDAAILGMPAEEDWILYAPYSDKTLMRNVLTFTLDASLGHYAPRCRFVELFLNDQYQGVYVMMEKIKRDNNRLDLAKLKAEDVTGEELTGGYIVKIDKTTGGGGEGWFSTYMNEAYQRTFFQYEYPKQEEVQPAQKEYIKNYISQVEAAIHNNNLDGENGFRQLANESSFVDYLIMTELGKNVDGYRLSTFLHKDKNGKLNAGPLWDFNLAYGNADYYNGSSAAGFQFEADLGEDYWQNPFWWAVLYEDNTFRKNLKNRWNQLRASQLSDDRLFGVIDSLTSLLNEAQYRNFQRWPILNQYVWPNAYIGYSYSSEVNWMRSWINNRLKWLDAKIDGLYVGAEDLHELADMVVYPNPFDAELHISMANETSDKKSVVLYTVQGGKLLDLPISPFMNRLTIDGSRLKNLPAGVYILQVIQNERIVFTEKLIKQ